MDTGNTFIAGKDPLEFCKVLRKHLSHCHIKDVSPALAARCAAKRRASARRRSPVGGGVNAANIEAVVRYLRETAWDGVATIECHGSDENTRKSLEFMRRIVRQ